MAKNRSILTKTFVTLPPFATRSTQIVTGLSGFSGAIRGSASHLRPSQHDPLVQYPTPAPVRSSCNRAYTDLRRIDVDESSHIAAELARLTRRKPAGSGRRAWNWGKLRPRIERHQPRKRCRAQSVVGHRPTYGEGCRAQPDLRGGLSGPERCRAPPDLR